jgi:glycosyltransferase involved in cell wall biosynthesis
MLSIVTINKDNQAGLHKTIESLKKIDDRSFQWICIDSASKDGSIELANQFKIQDDVVISEKDTGIYNAMNKGVALARGDYVLFINGDDALVADGFPKVMEALSRGVDKIICATTVVGDIASPTEILVARPWRLLFVNSIPHPSSFVYRDLLLRRPFREDLRIASDYDFFLGAYLAGQSFRVLTVPTALHQRGGASGDSHRSQAELECVRRDRLGWRHALVNGMAAIYRKSMRLLRKRTA